MVTVATIGFLVVVAIVLFAGAASYIYRGAPRRGSLLLVLSVGLAVLTYFEIHPALPAADGSFTFGAARQNERERLRIERDALAAELAQKTRDNEALSKTSAFFNKLHRERLVRIADEIESVKSTVFAASSGIVADVDTGELPVTAVVDGAAGFEAVIGELRKLKTLRVRRGSDVPSSTLALVAPSTPADGGTSGVIVEPPAKVAVRTTTAAATSVVVQAMLQEPSSTQPRSTKGPTDAAPSMSNMAREAGIARTETIEALRRSLDAKMAAPPYQVNPLETDELIAGRPGKYYVIEFKNPKTANKLTFDSGKYVFQTVGPTFLESFKAFEADVLRQLEGRVTFELYTRSNADVQPFRGTADPAHDYKRLTFLPGTGSGRYLANPVKYDVPVPITNAELPNMRAEYLKRLLSEVYSNKPIGTLQGEIVKSDGPDVTVRSAELVLFVAW